MRAKLPDILEEGRETRGPYGSRRSWGANGRFYINGPCGAKLLILANSADLALSKGWEHVSVSTERRTPNWTEMCFVKDLFWNDDETVVQYHPAKAEYVNNHPHVLHLWRHFSMAFPTPPSFLVGDKTKGVLSADEVRAIIAAQDADA